MCVYIFFRSILSFYFIFFFLFSRTCHREISACHILFFFFSFRPVADDLQLPCRTMISLVLKLRNSTFYKLVLNELVTKDDGKKRRATAWETEGPEGCRNYSQPFRDCEDWEDSEFLRDWSNLSASRKG